MFWFATGEDDFVLTSTKSSLAMLDEHHVRYAFKPHPFADAALSKSWTPSPSSMRSRSPTDALLSGLNSHGQPKSLGRDSLRECVDESVDDTRHLECRDATQFAWP